MHVSISITRRPTGFQPRRKGWNYRIPPSISAISKPLTLVLPDLHSRGSVLDDNLPFNGVGLGQGKFTRYGDVGELVALKDDKFVIMGMGDQVLMTFGQPAAPRAGYHRVLVLKILQYYKAYYVNTAVASLPFGGWVPGDDLEIAGQ
jgi:hypothetical protein